MKRNEILFRSSQVGNLMVDGRGSKITEKQREKIIELEKKREDKGLTKNQGELLKELIAKRDAPFELGATAKSFIEDVYLQNEFGFNLPVVNHELLKGRICEDDSVGLVDKYYKIPGIRTKNKQHFKSDIIKGTPDVVVPYFSTGNGEYTKHKTVEDVKSNFTISTYFNAKPDKIYYGQGQAYLHLTDSEVFVLYYCLVPTPSEILQSLKMRLWYQYGQPDQSEDPLQHEINEDYEKDLRDLIESHSLARVPEEMRVKRYVFERNDDYIDELRKRIELARDYYETLKLNRTFDASKLIWKKNNHE